MRSPGVDPDAVAITRPMEPGAIDEVQMTTETRYRIRLQVHGELSPAWSAVFGGLAVAPGAEGTTVMSGDLPDEAALHGLIAQVRDLGIQVVAVEAHLVGHDETAAERR
jgi:hypothetical protein